MIVGLFFFMVGLLLAIAGSIWMLILAFMDNILWGLAFLFLPSASLIFLILKWHNTDVRKSFSLQLGGTLISLFGGIISYTSLPKTVVSSSRRDVSSEYRTSRSRIRRSSSISSQTVPMRITVQTTPTNSPSQAVLQGNQNRPKSSPQEPDSYYEQGINTGLGAASIAQSAASKDDWVLVASRWQKAIALMKAEPSYTQNYALAQKKIVEYERNLAYAQEKTKPTVP